MAENQQKRLREEEKTHDSDTLEFNDSNLNLNPKRQKPYNNILSLLDEEEEEEQPTEDLSAIFTTLEQELSSSNSSESVAFDFDSPPYAAEEEIQHQQGAASSTSACGDNCAGADEDDGVKSVMRHLLEASDDELGIPSTEEHDDETRSAENFPFAFGDEGLWELEDVAANYYTMLQSELFL